VFNAVKSTLTLHGKFSSGDNPSWITANANRSVLYAVNENTVGAVQSFSINSNGTLSGPIDTVDTEGDGPAFCAQLSNGVVATMNYGSGNGSFTPTTIDEKTFDPPSSFVDFPPPPPPNVSHPHMVLEYGEELFVPDLGADKIWRLNVNSYQIHGSIPQPKGSGPRHIAIYNDRLFTIHELSSKLSVQSIPNPPNGKVINYASHSIIPLHPPSGAPGAVYAAAEILISSTSPQFPKSYIYVSNRNTGRPAPEGDSIAIFEHVNQGQKNEGLVLINQVFTGLNQIRGMEIGNKANGGDKYLMAGAFDGTGGVVIFRRTEQGKNLEFVVRNQDIPTRTSFVWP